MDTESSDIDDRLILKRAVFQQDKEALSILYAKYYPEVRRYITSRFDCMEDVEDLAQDVFVELSKGKGHYDGKRNVARYLFGIAKKIIYQYHKQKTRSVKNISIVSIDKVVQRYDNLQHLDFEKQIFTQDLKMVIEETMAKLPTKAREAIRLRYINGLSAKESAEKAGCSVHTFCQRIIDAKKNLRKYQKKIEEKL